MERPSARRRAWVSAARRARRFIGGEHSTGSARDAASTSSGVGVI